MSPIQYCREKVRSPGSSLYYSTLFLEREKQDAITAVHAYAREITEVLDECQEVALARIKLEWWRGEIASTFAGRPTHPVARALVPAIASYHLPEDRLLELIDGLDHDLSQTRYSTSVDLRTYCERIGSNVWLLAALIFQYTDATTLAYARELGVALQLTAILRDMGKHARRHRIYIPSEELDRFEVPMADILNGNESGNIQRLVATQIEGIHAQYERALACLPERDRLSQLPGLIMAAIARTTLEQIRKDGCHVLRERVTLAPMRMLWIAWRTQHGEKRRHSKLKI